MLAYTLLRRDRISGSFGYVVRQHHTLRAALQQYPWHEDDKLLYRTQGFISKGATIAILDVNVIPLDKR